ncbi:MAG TPA: hypothetical protein VLX28_11690 [Thermoanaerobaculia bacterium]|nr:hypothetical protein [Thermoanaerobaculia bacterium]
MANTANPNPSKPSVLTLPGTAPRTAVVPLTAPATPAGSTPLFRFTFDPSLGANGQALATALAQTAEQDFAAMQRYFGVTPGHLPFIVNIVPGGHGASHGGCTDTHIQVDAFSGTDSDLVRFVLVAEVAEVFMAAKGNGWDCGASNGEGLSRIMATEQYPLKLGGFASASTWLSHGRPDWVDQTEPTDGDFVSIGCAALFLNYLRYHLGYTWRQIVQAGGSTLAQTYKTLTGRTDALARFSSLLERRFLQVPPPDIAGDNPFPLRPDLLFYDRANGESTMYRADLQGNTQKINKTYDGWRTSWAAIVPGNFGGSGSTDLLFYDRAAGQGEFYVSDGSSNVIHQLKLESGWRGSWSIVLAGNFTGGSTSDLLFYDPAAGVGEIYKTDGQGNINLVKTHTDWRHTWSIILAGNFTGGKFSDLLFYDPTAGVGEIYSTDGRGNINRVKTFSDWRTSWSIIVPGNFVGSGFTDLVFYDRAAGVGEIYACDGHGNLTLAKSDGTWRTSWAAILAGNFTGKSFADLLFYDPGAGVEEVYSSDGKGNLSLVKSNAGWRRTWSILTPGNFAGNTLTELVLYDAAAGAGEIWSTDGKGNFGVLKSYGGRRTSWSLIVPGNYMGGTYTDLLYYDAGAGVGEFYSTDGEGNLGFAVVSYNDWRNTWAQIVPGTFSDSQYAGLLFYDRGAGTGEFYTSDGKGHIELLASHTNWRNTWTLIVAGHFTAREFSDVLFYEGSSGYAELYSTDGKGGIALIASFNWDKGWTHLVPGNFTGLPLADLFFYSAQSQLGGFLVPDGKDGLTLLRTYDQKGSSTNQPVSTAIGLPRPPSWTQITRGNFAGLVFYSLGTSTLLEFCKIDGKGGVTTVKAIANFDSATIGAIVAGAFS